jgi:hypothetical protein
MYGRTLAKDRGAQMVEAAVFDGLVWKELERIVSRLSQCQPRAGAKITASIVVVPSQ